MQRAMQYATCDGKRQDTCNDAIQQVREGRANPEAHQYDEPALFRRLPRPAGMWIDGHIWLTCTMWMNDCMGVMTMMQALHGLGSRRGVA